MTAGHKDHKKTIETGILVIKPSIEVGKMEADGAITQAGFLDEQCGIEVTIIDILQVTINLVDIDEERDFL